MDLDRKIKCCDCWDGKRLSRLLGKEYTAAQLLERFTGRHEAWQVLGTAFASYQLDAAHSWEGYANLERSLSAFLSARPNGESVWEWGDEFIRLVGGIVEEFQRRRVVQHIALTLASMLEQGLQCRDCGTINKFEARTEHSIALRHALYSIANASNLDSFKKSRKLVSLLWYEAASLHQARLVAEDQLLPTIIGESTYRLLEYDAYEALEELANEFESFDEIKKLSSDERESLLDRLRRLYRGAEQWLVDVESVLANNREPNPNFDDLDARLLKATSAKERRDLMLLQVEFRYRTWFDAVRDRLENNKAAPPSCKVCGSSMLTPQVEELVTPALRGAH